MFPVTHAPFITSKPSILIGAAPTDMSGIELCRPDWPIFAVDGGVHTAQLHGYVPRAVIGDMDSIGDHGHVDEAIEKVHLPGQDDTDFEKSLRLIDAPIIIGFGFLGARLDHTLAALHALASQDGSRPIILAGKDDAMLCVDGDCQFELPVNTRVSLWPLGRQQFVKSRGLAWPIDGITMEIGKQIGTSNRVTETNVKIQAGSGEGYMVILPADCLGALLTAAFSIACISV